MTSTGGHLGHVGLDNVSVLGPYLVNPNYETVDHTLRLEPDRFLHSCFTLANPEPSAEPYDGWERTRSALRTCDRDLWARDAA